MNKSKTESKKSYPLIFWLILVLIPVLVILLLEIVLRLVDYGSELDLVTETTIQGTSYYKINESVAKRYFSGSEQVIPEARNDLFLKEKTERTYRVFCMGGSSTAGWPFLYNATFPSLFKDRLQLDFPDKNIEVINFGISAVNSFSVLDLIGDLKNYQPDLFVIYMGHNEFYGALGVASTRKIGNSRSIIKLYLNLQKIRLVRFIRNIIRSLKQQLADKQQQGESRTLMQQMIGNKYIRYHDSEYRTAMSHFRQNLGEIIQTLNDANTPVLVGTTVSNLSDFKPFKSLYSETFSDTSSWNEFFAQGKQAEDMADYETALYFYEQAAELDTMPAKVYFHSGRCYESLGDFKKARAHYRRARDFDALRFRTSSEFNEIIKQECARRSVPCVNVEEYFEQQSPNGLIGNELILEHLHPNVIGYLRIAEAFYNKLRSSHLRNEAGKEWLSDVEWLSRAHITDLELEIANIRIQQLTSRYPFEKKVALREPDENAGYEAYLQKIAGRVLNENMPFNDACYALAEYLIDNGRPERAETYYQALIKIRPMNYYPYLYLGNVLFAQEKIVEAEEAYRHSLKRSRHLPFAYAKLGLIYLSDNRPERAVEILKQAIEISSNTNQLKAADKANMYYLLGTAYAQTSRFNEALETTRRGIQMYPSDQRLRVLKQKIEMAIRMGR
ncbi:tetratricopeptide repeat protein [candidate division KSB1 bacterium]|nr:tetratricopeptide repeat protein [candidate division KSB1 bacterium]